MRAFAEAWPEDEIVQQAVGRLPWGHNIVLLTQVKEPERRLAYATAAARLGWSRNVLVMLVKDPADGPTIGLLLCKSRNEIVAEYALRDDTKPLGVAEYQLAQALPDPLQTALTTIEQIERELGG
jgi:hypothetical protein